MKRWVLSLVLGFGISGAAPLAYGQTEAESQLLMRGEAELESGEYEAANKTFRDALALDPKNAAARIFLGRTQILMGKPKEAIETLRAAQADGVDVKADLGAAYYHAGENTQALALLGEAAKAEPKNGDVRYLHGLALYKAGKYPEARVELAAARELNPELEAETLIFGAAAAVKAGDKKTAEAELKQAVEVAEPGTATAKTAREALANLRGKSLEFSFGLTGQYDTNVLLVPESGGLFTPQEISNKEGYRGVFTFDGAWLPRLGETWRGAVRYGLYQSAHMSNRDVLSNFDLTNHNLGFGLERRTDETTFSLPYTLSLAYLDTFGSFDHYSTTNALVPTWWRTFGKHSVGISNAIGYENFSLEPASVTLDGEQISQSRDNLFDQLTASYRFLFAEGRGYVGPSLSALYANAKAKSSWDYFGGRLAVSALVPLGSRFGFAAGAGYIARSYANPFPVNSVAEDRSDSEIAANAALTLSAGAWNAVAGVNYTRNDSTIDVFTYDRVIYSLGLGAQF